MAHGRLLRSSGVVMALTTGKHKMLRAAYEAIYQGTPIIISDSPMLKEEFGRGAILVENSAEAIAAAVREMQVQIERYRREALELRTLKERRWEKNRQQLLGKLGIGQEASPRTCGHLNLARGGRSTSSPSATLVLEMRLKVLAGGSMRPSSACERSTRSIPLSTPRRCLRVPESCSGTWKPLFHTKAWSVRARCPWRCAGIPTWGIASFRRASTC